MFLAMNPRAVHKNHNSTLFSFLIIPLWFYIAFLIILLNYTPLIFSSFIAKGITCCAYFLQWDKVQSWKPITLHWIFLELFQAVNWFLYSYITPIFWVRILYSEKPPIFPIISYILNIIPIFFLKFALHFFANKLATLFILFLDN